MFSALQGCARTTIIPQRNENNIVNSLVREMRGNKMGISREQQWESMKELLIAHPCKCLF